jgi:hypothetical protein
VTRDGDGAAAAGVSPSGTPGAGGGTPGPHPGPLRPAPPSRATAAIASFATVAIFGYAAHRVGFSFGEPDPRTVGPTLHIAYFWRLSTALWWGSLAAIGGWRYPGVGAVAARALPYVVAAAVIAAFVVP